MSEPTHKALALQRESMTLLLHPGQSNQRALRTVRQQRLDHQSLAVAQARDRHGSAPLAWLMPDGTTVPVA